MSVSCLKVYERFWGNILKIPLEVKFTHTLGSLTVNLKNPKAI